MALWVSQLVGTTGGSPPRHIQALLAPAAGSTHVDAHTTLIADGFLDLNEQREQADYDHDAVFTRPDTRGRIALARRVVDTVEQANTDEALRFFGLVAMQAKVQPR